MEQDDIEICEKIINREFNEGDRVYIADTRERRYLERGTIIQAERNWVLIKFHYMKEWYRSYKIGKLKKKEKSYLRAGDRVSLVHGAMKIKGTITVRDEITKYFYIKLDIALHPSLINVSFPISFDDKTIKKLVKKRFKIGDRVICRIGKEKGTIIGFESPIRYMVKFDEGSELGGNCSCHSSDLKKLKKKNKSDWYIMKPNINHFDMQEAINNTHDFLKGLEDLNIDYLEEGQRVYVKKAKYKRGTVAFAFGGKYAVKIDKDNFVLPPLFHRKELGKLVKKKIKTVLKVGDRVSFIDDGEKRRGKIVDKDEVHHFYYIKNDKNSFNSFVPFTSTTIRKLIKKQKPKFEKNEFVQVKIGDKGILQARILEVLNTYYNKEQYYTIQFSSPHAQLGIGFVSEKLISKWEG